MYRRIGLAPITGAALAFAVAAYGQTHDHDTHRHPAAAASTVDDRSLVKFPEPMRAHMLANMRDHLQTLQEIQDALARQEYEPAGDIAEQRLGMSSLKLHGAHEVAKFMPDGMQAIGTAMHQAASRFALAAKDAAATGDVRPALQAMARITQQCVACHASYRAQ